MPPLRQSEPGSDGNEEVLCIPQSAGITKASPSDCLVSYPGHSLGGGVYSSAEMQLIFSTAPRHKSTGLNYSLISAGVNCDIDINTST